MDAARWSEEIELDASLRFVDELVLPRPLAHVERGRLFVRDASGLREPLREGPLRRGVNALSWSPDGRTLYLANRQIVAIDVVTGAWRDVTRLDSDSSLWGMAITPDGRTLYFRRRGDDASYSWPSRICAVDTDGTNERVIYEPPSGAGRLWTFACDFSCSIVRAILHDRDTKPIIEMDLEGRDARRIGELPPLRIQDSCVERFHLFDETWSVQPGVQRVPSASPDDSAMTFMKDDHELWLQRSGERARCVLRARAGSDPSRPPRFPMEPAWSSDGTLLCFSSTASRRSPVPRAPASLAKLAERYGEQSAVYRRAWEDAQWDHQHRSGIIDWIAGTVWMTEGCWRHGTWAPDLWKASAAFASPTVH